MSDSDSEYQMIHFILFMFISYLSFRDPKSWKGMVHPTALFNVECVLKQKKSEITRYSLCTYLIEIYWPATFMNYHSMCPGCDRDRAIKRFF